MQNGSRIENAARIATACDDVPLDQAVQEVDRSLLRWTLGLSPRERLRAATRAGTVLVRLRRART